MSFQALADTKISSELYEDGNELLLTVKNGRSLFVGVTISLQRLIKGTLGVSGSEAALFLNKLSKYNEKVVNHNVCVS